MALRFKLDENITLDATTLLGEAGHEAQTVLQERLGGHADPQVLNACRGEARILVTLDLDFADVRAYPPASHAGIWVLRPVTQSIENTLTLLRSALALLGRESPEKRLWVVEPGRVRIRE